jgi:hypothetical protein
MESRIIKVDRAFTPDKWIDAQDALRAYSRGIVMASFGETVMTLRGGTNASTGNRSVLDVGSIIVVDTGSHLVTDFGYAPLERRLLFKRDRHMCAYCGQVFPEKLLEAEHITPEAQGGAYTWGNLVSACRQCNSKKGCRRPEEAGMKLLYVPYAPNRFEHLILSGRRITADQMDFLLARVSKNSRVL